MKIVSYIILGIAGFFVGLSLYFLSKEKSNKQAISDNLAKARKAKAQYKKQAEKIDSINDLEILEQFEQSLIENNNGSKEKEKTTN